jgi:pilus assembly protein CpaB
MKFKTPAISQKTKLLALSIILGLLATVLVQAYIRKSVHTISGGKLVPVLFCKFGINEGEQITADKIIIRNIPEHYVHLKTIKKDMLDLIINQRAAANIQKDEAITWDSIALIDKLKLSDYLGMTERAITLRVENLNSFSGMIQPGDRIDVLWVSRDNAGDRSANAQMRLETILQNAYVLAVDNRLNRNLPLRVSNGKAQNANNQPDAPKVNSITLKVSPKEAALLAFADAKGKIVMTLRNKSDIFTTKVPALTEIGFQDAVNETKSNLLKKVDEYPTVYENGKPVKSGYYPESQIVREELVRMTPEESNKKVLEVK